MATEENIYTDIERDAHLLIEKAPGWLIRSGITIMALIVVVLLILSSLVRYPDKMICKGIITSERPPVDHITVNAGRVDSIFVKNNQSVRSGDKILLISNPSKIADIEALEFFVNNYETSRDAFQQSLKRFPRYLEVGDIQQEYSRLELLFFELELKQKESASRKKIEILQNEITKTNVLIENQIKQKNLAGEQVSLIEKGYIREKNLNSQGVLSDLDFEKNKINLLNEQKQYSILENGIISNQIKVEQLRLEIHQLKESKLSTENTSLMKIQESISNIKQAIRKWRQNYLVVSQIDGLVTIKSNIVPKGSVSEKQVVATVIPKGGVPNRFVRALAFEKDGVGRVEIKNSVILKVDGYPYKEFGTIKGEVAAISILPDKDANGIAIYEIIIPVPQKLVTNNRKIIPGNPNTGVVAEIITHDRSILERVLNQVLNLLRNN